MRTIKKVAVLGAGVMGQGIAAHLAGAGIPVYLLDIVPPKFSEEDAKQFKDEKNPLFRNKFALGGIEAIKQSRPSVIYSKRDLKLIKPGNFEDDWSKLAECDWIVEVVIERLDIKHSVFSKVEKVMSPGTIISSNTSGLPLNSLVEGRSEAFKKHFLVTHFFNPVRYLKLVEVISSQQTDKQVLATMVDFLDNKLGKGIVYGKDTPNFIANRIGTFAFMSAIKRTLDEGYTVEEVDTILGPAMGKPKSAMYRTGDLVGIDVLSHVARNNFDGCPNDEQRDIFSMPDVITGMIEKGWTGNKAKQGFYKKTKDASGKKLILRFDFKTGDYVPSEKSKFDSIKAAKGIENVGQRIKKVVESDDRAGQFAWKVTRDTLIYAMHRIPEIADDIVNVDNAMKWGFNWDIGPFEIIDAIGAKAVAERIQKDGLKVPDMLTQVIEKGDGVFYKEALGKRSFFNQASSRYEDVPVKSNVIFLKPLKEQNKIIDKNSSANLIDLGDGVICLEFQSKMNAIDDDIISLGFKGLELVKNNYVGMVVANQADNFSVGANLMLLWLEAQQKNWDKIENIVKQFQDFCMALRYSPKPVVAAPFGLTLGGGCEIAMGADAARAYAETYIGLVEVGVGLIPGGGGCKNMLLNCEATLRAKGQKVWMSEGDGGPFPKVQRAFERIGFAKVATSAKEGMDDSFLRSTDKLSLNKDTLIYDAKQDVLELAKNYQQPIPREDILLPGVGGKMAIVSSVRNFVGLGQISEHDALIAEKLAHILCGGDKPTQTYVSEQDILDLEREVFLQLAGTEKSQARMQHMLMNNKPLRN